MAKYITDTATGYFIGKPVVYSSQNDAYLEALQAVSYTHLGTTQEAIDIIRAAVIVEEGMKVGVEAEQPEV